MTDSRSTDPAPLSPPLDKAGTQAQATATGRPRQRRRRKDARPAEIAQAAMDAFAANGFAATRLDDIAARAGVAKGTIYLYFDSKEALFEELVRANVLTNIDRISGLIDSFPGPTEDLLRLILANAYQTVQGSNVRAILRIIMSEGTRFPKIVAFYHREVISKGEAMLGRVLARGVERGEFRDAPISQAHMVVIAPVIAATMWQMTFDSQKKLDIEAYSAAHVDTLFNGLRSRPD